MYELYSVIDGKLVHYDYTIRDIYNYMNAGHKKMIYNDIILDTADTKDIFVRKSYQIIKMKYPNCNEKLNIKNVGSNNRRLRI